MASTDRRWYALVYQTTTGQVYDELPLIGDPAWSQKINDPGSWTALTPIGGSGGLDRDTLRSLVSAGRWGVACCYGTGSQSDYIAQAGPIWSAELQSESPPVLQIGGTGLWGMWSARIQVPGSWTASKGFADSTSVATYGPTSLQGIAVAILTDAVTRGSLPVDLPAAIAGTQSRTYYGYNLATVGQTLQELTQVDQGPDILLAPYFSDPNHVRWSAQIGNPTLSQPGTPLYFDYGANLTSVLPSCDGSHMSTTSYVKASGVSASVLWAQSTDSTLIAAGWPLMEWVDTGHSDLVDQAAIQAQATANQALYGRPVETWKAVARTDVAPLLGIYGPGVSAYYGFSGDPDHPWISPGQYLQRIVGLSNGQAQGEVAHLLQATQGAV